MIHHFRLLCRSPRHQNPVLLLRSELHSAAPGRSDETLRAAREGEGAVADKGNKGNNHLGDGGFPETYGDRDVKSWKFDAV